MQITDAYRKYNEDTFDSYVFKSVNHAIGHELKRKNKCGQYETPLSSLPDYQLGLLAFEDTELFKQTESPEQLHNFLTVGKVSEINDSQLAKALLLLGMKDRAIILLYFYHGMTDGEIGQALHMGRSTIQKRRTTALDKLKEIMR